MVAINIWIILICQWSCSTSGDDFKESRRRGPVWVLTEGQITVSLCLKTPKRKTESLLNMGTAWNQSDKAPLSRLLHMYSGRLSWIWAAQCVKQPCLCGNHISAYTGSLGPKIDRVVLLYYRYIVMTQNIAQPPSVYCLSYIWKIIKTWQRIDLA